MNLYRTLASSLFSLALGATGDALAAAAVAAGSNGYTFTITDEKHLDKAKADALAECRQRAPDCEVIAWAAKPAAIALAKSADGSTYSKVRDTPELARDDAMKACRKERKGCKFAALYWEPGGFWAGWAGARLADGAIVVQHFTYDYTTEAEARADALAGCKAKLAEDSGLKCEVWSGWGAWTRVTASSPSTTTYQLVRNRAEAETLALKLCRENAPAGEACKVTQVDENAGPKAKPASFDKVFAQTALARARVQTRAPARPRPVAAPRDEPLSCTNRCVNGSCVRTFANGRTERWEAPRVLDPFTNNWKWDTSSCGN